MTIEEARRWYAEEIRAVAHLMSDRVVEAFARVPREAFLGAGPWQIARSFEQPPNYRTTRDADPRHIYHNVLVAIDPARQLHNGLPSALAQWIEAVDVRAGDRVLHIGTGLGYYTAIFAELVGPAGGVGGYGVAGAPGGGPGCSRRHRARLLPGDLRRARRARRERGRLRGRCGARGALRGGAAAVAGRADRGGRPLGAFRAGRRHIRHLG